MNDPLTWLQKFYARCCDGDWEHSYGFTIVTLDNPGWSVKVALTGTYLQGSAFELIKIERSPDDWIYCSVRDDVFTGFGGSENLAEILTVFKDWVEAQPKAN